MKAATEDSFFFTHTLPCGLRVICAPSPTQVVYCGIAVDAGTRDELAQESGFRSYSTFSTAFKRRKGIPVKAWMQEVQTSAQLSGFTKKLSESAKPEPASTSQDAN